MAEAVLLGYSKDDLRELMKDLGRIEPAFCFLREKFPFICPQHRLTYDHDAEIIIQQLMTPFVLFPTTGVTVVPRNAISAEVEKKQKEGGLARTQVRKALFAPFDPENHTFAAEGLGQTQTKLNKTFRYLADLGRARAGQS